MQLEKDKKKGVKHRKRSECVGSSKQSIEFAKFFNLNLSLFFLFYKGFTYRIPQFLQVSWAVHNNLWTRKICNFSEISPKNKKKTLAHTFAYTFTNTFAHTQLHKNLI